MNRHFCLYCSIIYRTIEILIFIDSTYGNAFCNTGCECVCQKRFTSMETYSECEFIIFKYIDFRAVSISEKTVYAMRSVGQTYVRKLYKQSSYRAAYGTNFIRENGAFQMF